MASVRSSDVSTAIYEFVGSHTSNHVFSAVHRDDCRPAPPIFLILTGKARRDCAYLFGQICLIYEDLVGGYSLATRLWLFILFQWTAYTFLAALGESVPDIPEDVTIQLQRTLFLSSKVGSLHRVQSRATISREQQAQYLQVNMFRRRHTVTQNGTSARQAKCTSRLEKDNTAIARKDC